VESNDTFYGASIQYCRSYDADAHTVTFYVSDEENANKHLEAGTQDFPFSNLQFVFLEVFNNLDQY
jgi:hypothetical protein